MDEFREVSNLLLKIQRAKVREALLQNLEIVAGHLDLEGLAYIKVLRTGAQECFSMDVTSRVLELEGFTIKDRSKLFWSKPSMEKWKK